MRPLCRRVPFILLAIAWLAAAPRALEVDRLVTLARVWAAVKYLHPLILQKEIDWDGALIRAIPHARAAGSDDAFAEAVGAMLRELGDPPTRIVRRTTATRPAADVPLVTRQGDVLVISAGPYANARGVMALYSEQARLPAEIAKARQVVIDVRNHSEDPDEAAFAAGIVSDVGGLTSERLAGPSSRVVLHSGYRPQTGTSSGGYYSAFLTLPGAAYPASAAPTPARVVFVTDAQSPLPTVALTLRNAGKAVLVSDRPLDAGAIAMTRSIALPGNWRARIRVEDVAATIAADAVADDPMAEALAIVQGKKNPAPAANTAAAMASEPHPRTDADYKDMVYPDAEHRLLAAFRIWSVIDYFYPYKSLIGNWDEAFAGAIPRFAAAASADEYAEAVAQFVARIEDGHANAFGHPSMVRILGAARPSIEVREVEGEMVVTRLLQPPPADTDLRVGDVVVSVDGEAIRARMDRLRPFVASSTEAARTSRLAGLALQGAADSPATLVVRGAGGRDRTVRIPRTPPGPRPSPPGEPYRILDGNIGYVNLVRLEVSEVDAMFEALSGTKAIVFDMRGYPRGTAWSIAPRINTKRAAVGATFRRVQVSGADPSDGASPSIYFEQRLPATDKPLYRGRTVMLIDDRAISQAEHTALFFEAANGTTFVGTPTAGANGDVTNFTVPGGFRVTFSGHDVRHADDRQLQRLGIQPHVRIAPTIAGIRAGRDELLERALQYLNQAK